MGPEHQLPPISIDTYSNRQPMNGDPSHVHDHKAENAEIALIVSFLVLGRRGAVCSGSFIAHVIGCECSISSSSKVQQLLCYSTCNQRFCLWINWGLINPAACQHDVFVRIVGGEHYSIGPY